MAAFVPGILFEYLSLFRSHFTKPSFAYFGGYWASPSLVDRELSETMLPVVL